MFDIEKITVAKTVNEAIDALMLDDEALIIAGGTDLLVQVREGKHAGKRFVSINGIKALKRITLEANGDIVIGALSTFADVTESAIIEKNIPTLGYATNQAGGPQLRNAGTIGGNVCNGVTSADSASTLLTLNASLEIKGAQGEQSEALDRTEPLEGFYKGPGRVNLAHGEVLCAIRIAKKDYEGFYGSYIKFAQRAAMDIATLGTAVHLKLSEDKKKISELRLAFGVAAPTPIRCHKAEDAAKDAVISEELFEKIAGIALSEVNPRTSWRASKEFRMQLVSENTKRALREAITKAGGAVQ